MIPATRFILPLLLVFTIAIAGCDQESPQSSGDSEQRGVRVASLVPAVTNVLLGLEQGELLVAVSNYDTDGRVAGLPRAGDLLGIDWEQIAAARPTHMVVQIAPEKTPPGALQRARELGIELVHVRIERLEDIAATIQLLEERLAADASGGNAGWRKRFDAELEAAAAGGTKGQAPTLIALSPDLSFVAGRNTYLDDLLGKAGSVNVVPADMAPYPKLDGEALASLRPRRIVLIMPQATDAQTAEARRALETLAPVWGLTWDDVIQITDGYAMVPGWSVIEILRHIAAAAPAKADTSRS